MIVINLNTKLKSRGYHLKVLFCSLLFISFVSKFSLASASNIINNVESKKRILRTDYKECPVCYNEIMINKLSQSCNGLSVINNFDDLSEEDLLCLCNFSVSNPDVEECHICSGLNIEEIHKKCSVIKSIESLEGSNEVIINKNFTNIYVNEDVNNNLNNNMDDNIITDQSNKSTEKKNNPVVIYCVIGGGFVFIAATGLFLAKRLINNDEEFRESEEIQMDNILDLHNLDDINIDHNYYPKDTLMPITPSLTNNQVSNMHYNDREAMYHLYQASTSNSEPVLNKNSNINDNSIENYRNVTSAPNISKGNGILVNRGNNYVNETRRSSLGINSTNSDDMEKAKPRKSKPHVTFSKGLTTMHEFLSNEWDKAIECEGLKKDSLVDLGWHNGIVVHNFNPNKEDEIKLRIGDGVIIRLAFDDGWAYAFNRNTGVVGMIPIICVEPTKTVKK
ncbi:hypothetical protein BCR32DRAFT_263771 [Anaeromyces robustus]|uniref:SH3 domain-containing protein n=1 Tax=Anaeromyces robustus TaxID=1754192 RepID=A0A1Y1XR19_9FUNG|nr:hypothetical protein BCR32DRAFT_263771 [Anaeromyces robustus]|eukprot:ORX88095.1 hypothetical protein BCR32DRAFT_263771 [Anaeromyces robustus]